MFFVIFLLLSFFLLRASSLYFRKWHSSSAHRNWRRDIYFAVAQTTRAFPLKGTTFSTFTSVHSRPHRSPRSYLRPRNNTSYPRLNRLETSYSAPRSCRTDRTNSTAVSLSSSRRKSKRLVKALSLAIRLIGNACGIFGTYISPFCCVVFCCSCCCNCLGESTLVRSHRGRDRTKCQLFSPRFLTAFRPVFRIKHGE